MRTLIVGDHFIPPDQFREAIAAELGKDFGPVSDVMWSGDRGRQHHEQQIMEKEGPEALATPEPIVAAAEEAELIAVHFAPVPRAVFEAAGGLRAVVVARAGVENVNVEAATEHGVAVVNVQGRNAPAVAEHAVALMLDIARKTAWADAAIKAGDWRTDFPGPMIELGGHTVGLIGFGQVGRQVARRLSGFGVELLVYDPYVERNLIDAAGAKRVLDLATIFRECDYVSLHARLTDETRRFLGRELFDLMKPEAYFVNTARSGMVNYDDLLAVLQEGRIGGAALDVHDDEPLPQDSPWRSLPNVTLTPHIAGVTRETMENSVQLVAEAIREVADTGEARNTVNAAQLTPAGAGPRTGP